MTDFPRVINRTRLVLFWLLSLGVALASLRFLPLGVEASMPFMLHHAETRALALYTHIGLAPVALALLPFQFAVRLRGRRPRLHRWMGRVYALAVLISAISGLALAIGTSAGPVAGWGFGVLAVLWLASTARGVQLAMAGDIARHRVWMIRSAALTLAAVTLRLYLPILSAAMGFEAAYPVIAWICWVPNLVIAEWLLMKRRRALPARAG